MPGSVIGAGDIMISETDPDWDLPRKEKRGNSVGDQPAVNKGVQLVTY